MLAYSSHKVDLIIQQFHCVITLFLLSLSWLTLSPSVTDVLPGLETPGPQKPLLFPLQTSYLPLHSHMTILHLCFPN